ncbi:MAG: ABC transporter permease [Archangiaceae bacterium]|nr:ABC transporter permease [Archangiaceae bacterium]
MSATTTLALRYLLRRKTRAALTTTAIVFGVALVVAMGGMVPTLTASLTSSVLSSVEQVDASISTTTQAPFPADVLTRVRAMQGVKLASGRVQGMVSLPAKSAPQLNGKPIVSLQLVGLERDEVDPVRPVTVTEGKPVKELSADDVLVSETLRDGAKLKLGDALLVPSVAGSRTFHVAGFVSTRPGGIESVFVTLPAAQETLGLTAQLSQVDVRFSEGVDAPATRQALLTALGSGYLAEASRGNTQLIDQVMRAAMPMQAFGVLAMVMAGFIIFITFRTVVVERRRDLGLLRALGASQRTVLAMVTVEGLLLGVVGTVLGILVGIGMERLVISGLAPVWRSQVGLVLEPQPTALKTLLVAVVLGVGGSVLSCLAPARQASRVSPREAMRPSGGDARVPVSRVRLGVGIALGVLGVVGLITGVLAWQSVGALCFIVAVFLVGPSSIVPLTSVFRRGLDVVMAQEGKLAQGNVARQRHRSSITASVMTVALAIIVALAALTNSTIEGVVSQIDRTLGADFMVMPPTMMVGSGSVGASADLARSLSAVEGVDVATSLRMGASRSGTQNVSLVGIDPQAYLKVAAMDFEAGTPESVGQLAQPRTLIMNALWAKQTGAKLQDQVELLTPNGPVQYRVVGIGNDVLNYRVPSAYLSQASLQQDFQVDSDLLVFVDLKQGVSSQSVRAELEQRLEAWPGFILRGTSEWRDKMLDDGRKKLNAMYVLLVVLVVPALIALANTLGINVLERVREIGLLRAIGSTQRQVRRLVLAESLLLACVGALVGIGVGLWLGLITVRAMESFGLVATFRIPVSGIATTAVIALVFGALAAVLPARHASRLKIVSALRHE